MALYEFKCSCGNIFETWCSSEEMKSGIKCSCGQVAKKHFGSFSFSFKGGSPSPTNTDKVVGRLAEESWLANEERKSQKEKIRKQSGEKFLIRDGEGYRAATEEDKKDRSVLMNSYDSLARDSGVQKVVSEHVKTSSLVNELVSESSKTK